MKKSIWLLALPLAAVAYGAWQVFDERESEGAFGLLETARELVAADPENAALAHRMLDRALALGPKPALREALLTERATLRTSSGAVTLALADWKALAALHPDDEQLKLRIAGLESRAGHPERALEIYESLLADKPTNGWVRALLAKEHTDQAAAEKSAAFERLEGLVSRADTEWLSPHFDRIVRLPVEDPARLGVLAELAASLPQRAVEQLKPAIASVGALLTQARADQTSSLRGSVNRYNLFGLIDDLYRAGRLEATVDFGLAALPFRTSLDHPGTIQDLALALQGLDRPRAAAAVVKTAVTQRPTWHADFLDSWCGILFDAESWPQLESTATQWMRRAGAGPAGRDQRADAAFYLGMAAFHQGKYASAVGALKQFLGARTEGPEEHAAGLAWLAVAQAQKALGDGEAVYNAYRAAADADPYLSAAAWVFLADAAARNSQVAGNKLKESTFLARAIAAEPARTSEWLNGFQEAGVQALAELEVNVPLLAKELRALDRWIPDGKPEPFLLYALAKHYIAGNQPAGAAIVLQRLLRDLPNFAPAYDQLALTQQLLQRPLAQAEAVMTRLELAGPDPATLKALKNLSAKLAGETLPGPLLRRWMQLEPGFTGAIELARMLELRGRPNAAFNTLMAVPRESLNDRDRVLFADVLEGLKQYAAVLTATEAVQTDGPFGVHAALLRLRAATQLADFKTLATALEQLEASDATIAPGSREAELVEADFEALLAARLGPAVLRFCKHFATSPKNRDGRSMNRAALAELLYGDPLQARHWVDAADALALDGSAVVGRLVLAEAQVNEVEEGRAVRDLRAESPAWINGFDLALIAALEGRRGEARARLAERLVDSPADSRLWLASAALDAIAPDAAQQSSPFLPERVPALLGPAAREPLQRIAGLNAAAGQRLLVLLLALDAPIWDNWALAHLRDPLQATLLGPFAVELSARAALAAGDESGARAQLAAGSARWKAFSAFWDLNEDVALLSAGGRPDHPSVVALRRLRRKLDAPARAGLPASQAELTLDASFEAAAGGNAAEAMRLAQLARAAAPGAAAPRLNLARVARKLAPELSKQSYLGYLLGPEWTLALAERQTVLAELFSLQATFTQPELDALRAAFPDAPEPVLGLAQLDLAEGSVEDALARLRAFTTMHAALEALAPGSSQPWFDFIVRYSPSAALDFAEHQLDLDPRYLEPWIQRALALEASGQLEEALELWRTLAQMSPDARVARGHAALVANLGSSHDEVIIALNLARRGADAAEYSGLVDFITARSLANVGAEYLAQSIDMLEALLAADSTPGVGKLAIRRRLGTTLLHRASPGDGARARPQLTAALAGARDELERDFLTALLNLSFNLDQELAAQAAPAPVSE